MKLPLTNVYAKGDYTIELLVGSHRAPVNLIPDTGSSTLVVKNEHYQPEQDSSLTATSIAQQVSYGVGGWAGPMVHSQVTLSDEDSEITLKKTPVAIAHNAGQSFAKADGILGLAYHHLNKGFDLSSYFQQKKLAADTYPWPFGDSKVSPNDSDLKQFQQFLWQHPEQDVEPYFTCLVQHGLTANCFTFISNRSSIHMAKPEATEQELKDDPLNQGAIILSQVQQASVPAAVTLPVLHDVYYNIELNAFQVGNNAPVKAAPLDAAHQNSYFSNAIVDTGASALLLTHQLFEYMQQQFAAISADFPELIAPFNDIAFQQTGIDMTKLNLNQWPDLIFHFTDTQGKDVTLTCPPQHYWQVNSPAPGKACFKVFSQQPQWPNQSILGLPLLNSYAVTFNRAEKDKGVIHFSITGKY